MAPEKNVNPRPSRADAIAQAQNGAPMFHMYRYSSVESSRVAAPSRKLNLRPRVSATTPVGTSKITMPTLKNAFAAKASALLSPASSRKSVLTPQMNEAASVVSSVRKR